ncbi:uncharacterized protein TNCV_4203821 [Trichonephila clavipes]|nr:uncharacterized protein TNCV_4203821 [Trichonephila clavipes]
MKFDRDGRRSYRNCDNYLDTELTPADIFDCPAILAALQKIGVFFLSTNLYADNIEQIARTVIWAHDLRGELDAGKAKADFDCKCKNKTSCKCCGKLHLPRIKLKKKGSERMLVHPYSSEAWPLLKIVLAARGRDSLSTVHMRRV